MRACAALAAVFAASGARADCSGSNCIILEEYYGKSCPVSGVPTKTQTYVDGKCYSCGNNCHFQWTCGDGKATAWHVNKGPDCSSKYVNQDFTWHECTPSKLDGGVTKGTPIVAHCTNSPPPPAITPAPMPPNCPGGSLSKCIAICPTSPPAVYTACVANCRNLCPAAERSRLLA